MKKPWDIRCCVLHGTDHENCLVGLGSFVRYHVFSLSHCWLCCRTSFDSDNLNVVMFNDLQQRKLLLV